MSRKSVDCFQLYLSVTSLNKLFKPLEIKCLAALPLSAHAQKYELFLVSQKCSLSLIVVTRGLVSLV